MGKQENRENGGLDWQSRCHSMHSARLRPETLRPYLSVGLPLTGLQLIDYLQEIIDLVAWLGILPGIFRLSKKLNVTVILPGRDVSRWARHTSW